MKILIAYASKYGTTEKCVNLLKEKLSGDIDVVNLKNENPIPGDYDIVIIGGPVYIGKLNKTVESYCINNLPALVDKKLGFFLCHMDTETPIADLLAKYYPKKLIESAHAASGFGGAFYVSKMNFLYKWMIKRSAGIETDQEKILYDEIDNFAQKFKS